MKKVSFIIAGLVSLLLVGCGGSEGNVASANDTVNVNNANSEIINSNGPVVASGLTPPPAFPEQ